MAWNNLIYNDIYNKYDNNNMYNFHNEFIDNDP